MAGSPLFHMEKVNEKIETAFIRGVHRPRCCALESYPFPTQTTQACVARVEAGKDGKRILAVHSSRRCAGDRRQARDRSQMIDTGTPEKAGMGPLFFYLRRRRPAILFHAAI